MTFADLRENDTRTCSACGKPVAPALKGYAQSIRACEVHLTSWHVSFEYAAAKLEAIAQGRAIGVEPFEAWARGHRTAAG